MDSNTSRWAQIVFWTEGDVLELHRREGFSVSRLEDGQYRFRQKNLPSWMALSFFQTISEQIFKKGYWPQAMTEPAKAESMKNFEKAIFPIWKGIEQKDIDSDARMTLSECMARPILAECVTMHKQDLAIRDSGFQPEKMIVTPEEMDRLRRKSATVQNMREWHKND